MKTYIVTEAQIVALKQKIYDTLMSNPDNGLGEMGDCKYEADRIVDEWLEEINLTDKVPIGKVKIDLEIVEGCIQAVPEPKRIIGQLSDTDFRNTHPYAHYISNRTATTKYGKGTTNYWMQHEDLSWTNYDCKTSNG